MKYLIFFFLSFNSFAGLTYNCTISNGAQQAIPAVKKTAVLQPVKVEGVNGEYDSGSFPIGAVSVEFTLRQTSATESSAAGVSAFLSVTENGMTSNSSIDLDSAPGNFTLSGVVYGNSNRTADARAHSIDDVDLICQQNY